MHIGCAYIICPVYNVHLLSKKNSASLGPHLGPAKSVIFARILDRLQQSSTCMMVFELMVGLQWTCMLMLWPRFWAQDLFLSMMSQQPDGFLAAVAVPLKALQPQPCPSPEF